MRMLRAKSAVCLIVSPARVAGILFFFFLLFAFLCMETCGGEEVARSPVLRTHGAARSLQVAGGGEGVAGWGWPAWAAACQDREAIKTVV